MTKTQNEIAVDLLYERKWFSSVNQYQANYIPSEVNDNAITI